MMLMMRMMMSLFVFLMKNNLLWNEDLQVVLRSIFPVCCLMSVVCICNETLKKKKKKKTLLKQTTTSCCVTTASASFVVFVAFVEGSFFDRKYSAEAFLRRLTLVDLSRVPRVSY